MPKTEAPCCGICAIRNEGDAAVFYRLWPGPCPSSAPTPEGSGARALAVLPPARVAQTNDQTPELGKQEYSARGRRRFVHRAQGAGRRHHSHLARDVTDVRVLTLFEIGSLVLRRSTSMLLVILSAPGSH
jgi:hypothetical protein